MGLFNGEGHELSRPDLMCSYITTDFYKLQMKHIACSLLNGGANVLFMLGDEFNSMCGLETLDGITMSKFLLDGNINTHAMSLLYIRNVYTLASLLPVPEPLVCFSRMLKYTSNYFIYMDSVDTMLLRSKIDINKTYTTIDGYYYYVCCKTDCCYAFMCTESSISNVVCRRCGNNNVTRDIRLHAYNKWLKYDTRMHSLDMFNSRIGSNDCVTIVSVGSMRENRQCEFIRNECGNALFYTIHENHSSPVTTIIDDKHVDIRCDIWKFFIDLYRDCRTLLIPYTKLPISAI